MRVKGDNLELISGLLMSSFILNYMVIRIKEKEFGWGERRKETEREGERSREERNEEESKA